MNHGSSGIFERILQTGKSTRAVVNTIIWTFITRCIHNECVPSGLSMGSHYPVYFHSHCILCINENVGYIKYLTDISIQFEKKSVKFIIWFALFSFVIWKVPTHFFKCSSSWPRQVGHFLLASPGSDETFFVKVGMSHTTNLRNGPAQYIS